MDVGIRALRDSLSSQLITVQEGTSITVTDHGRPIARIIPIDASSPYNRLVAEGIIVPPRAARAPLEPPIPVAGNVSELLSEQRR